MAQTKTKKKIKATVQPTEGAFVLKLVLYAILGALWIKVVKNGSDFQLPLPLGLLVGLFFTAHEHFRIDRKIEYAVLVIAALVGQMAPFGLYISF
jgi:hypothetical protein